MITKRKGSCWFYYTLLAGCLAAFSANAQTNHLGMVKMGTALKPAGLKVTQPIALDPGAKLKLAQGLGMKGNFTITGFGASTKVTPQAGFIDGKAFILLSGGIVSVDYQGGYAIMMPLSEGHLENAVDCEFKPSFAGKYLVDITVHSAYNQTTTYSATASNKFGMNKTDVTESVPDSNGHVTFIYEAKDTDWFTVYMNADKQWVFYSCEVTQLK